MSMGREAQFDMQGNNFVNETRRIVMENVTGKVVKCGAYPIKDPKPFTFTDPRSGQQKTITNTHRLSIQLSDGEWYGLGNTEKDAFIVKDDAGQWKVLGAGSDVLIKYELSPCGKYRNAKKSGLTILNLVEGQRFEKEGGNSSSTAGGSNASSTTNPAEVGQAINLTGLSLAQLIAMTDTDVMDAVKQYRAAKQRFTDAFNAKPVAPVADTSPNADYDNQPRNGDIDVYPNTPPNGGTDFDDDIPF